MGGDSSPPFFAPGKTKRRESLPATKAKGFLRLPVTQALAFAI